MPGLIIVAIVAAIWEWSAYNSSVKRGTGRLEFAAKSATIVSLWSSTSPAQARTYLAGSEPLDPQYDDIILSQSH